jgi:protein-tyrosine phosphatase
MTARTGVLFVCLGNICRSPLAEGIFIHRARERGLLDRFDIDSCGTGSWHIGERADPRSIAVAAKHGIELPSIGRQLDPKRDRERFHWLIAMDRSNRKNLLAAGFDESRIRLMRSFDPTLATNPTLFGDPGPELDVPDPYHWCGDGFENVYQMLDRACTGLLDVLAK